MDRRLILGGTGFIGATIVRRLALEPGTSSVSLSSAQCDLSVSEQCRETLPPLVEDATVIFAAGIPRMRSNTLAALQANLAMIHNLTELFCQTPPRRVIFLSSVEIYGQPSRLPIDEETEIAPRTLYGIGKVAAELMLEAWHMKSGVPLVTLRLPGIYGPGDKGRGLIGKLMQCVPSGESFQLYGDGSSQRDFVLAEDLAEIVATLTATEFTRLTLNVATGRSHSVAEIIKHVFALYDACPVSKVSQAEPDYDLLFDISRLHEVFPALAMTPLDEGLKRYATET